jgi:transposase, IS5 family
MSQMSFGDGEYAAKKKTTRREIFLAEMEQVVPWQPLLNLIEPFYPVAGRGRRPYPIQTMLRIHLMQNWFGLSDPAMEEALYEIGSMRKFARLSLTQAIPDETTILNFRRLIEANDLAPMIFERINAYLGRKGLLLKRGTIVDATIIAAPSSTKNESGERDPEMHQTKKGNQWFFGMKAHIGVDADSGLVHTVVTTPANEADVEVVSELLHGKESVVHADAGYTGAEQRVRRQVEWQIAAKRGRIKAMPEGRQKRRIEHVEHCKASVRARVEHSFRVIKRQFGYVKVRFRGLAKNHAQVLTLFALSNLWTARRKLLAMTGSLRPQLAS